jgi:hypothetical protein
VEVVLGLAEVQGEGVVEEAGPGQGLLQAVDGAGGRLEIGVQVGGGGVVGGAFGEQPPLFALAPPVEQVGPGQDELAAVAAVFSELTVCIAFVRFLIWKPGGMSDGADDEGRVPAVDARQGVV